MNKLVKTVSNSNLYYEFLQSLNGILKLTDRELELFATLLKFDVEYIDVPNKPKNIANTNAVLGPTNTFAKKNSGTNNIKNVF